MSGTRRAWAVILSLLFIQLFTFGPTASTLGVFFRPLIQSFGWTRAQVSSIALGYSFALGLGAFVCGWLLQKIDAGWIMGAGALLGAAGLVVAAQGHSLSNLFIGYVVVGAGVALAGATPTAVVAVNWFPHRRGTAVAVAMLGLGIGMAVAPLLITGVVVGWGWRAGMLAVAAPMALLAAPAALIMVRSGPAAESDLGVRYPEHHSSEEEGLEVGAALGRARFWLLAAVALCGEAACGGVFYHMIPYLIGAGYRPEAAASVMGAQAVLVTLGALLAGALADYFSPRPILSLSWLVLAVAVMLLIAARHPAYGIWPLAGFVLLWGIGMGNFSAMAPLVANALGMRRFSAFMGVITMCWFFGQGLGPPLAGRLFDRTGGYVAPLEMAIVLLIVSAVLTRLVAAPGEEVPASMAKAS